MKRHLVWVCFVLAAGIALIVVACTYIPPQGVYIQTFIQIYPGTKISRADQKALDAVLEKFDKSLYQIRIYDRGKLVKTQGSLQEALIDQTLVAAVDKASKQGVSESTLAICHLRKVVGNWQNKPMTPILPTQPPLPDPAHCERLVHQVTPILEKYIKKYSNDQVANVVKSSGR